MGSGYVIVNGKAYQGRTLSFDLSPEAKNNIIVSQGSKKVNKNAIIRFLGVTALCGIIATSVIILSTKTGR